MTESVKLRTKNIPDKLTERALYQLLTSMQADIAGLVAFANAHVHGGITAGAANSAVATTTATLNTNP